MESKIKTKKYKIISVVHSGRKDTRFKKVSADKYDGLIGTTIICKNLNDIKQFEYLRMKVLDSPFYKLWETTAIVSLWKEVKKSHVFYYCETINSIYILYELEDK